MDSPAEVSLQIRETEELMVMVLKAELYETGEMRGRIISRNIPMGILGKTQSMFEPTRKSGTKRDTVRKWV